MLVVVLKNNFRHAAFLTCRSFTLWSTVCGRTAWRTFTLRTARDIFKMLRQTFKLLFAALAYIAVGAPLEKFPNVPKRLRMAYQIYFCHTNGLNPRSGSGFCVPTAARIFRRFGNPFLRCAALWTNLLRKLVAGGVKFGCRWLFHAVVLICRFGYFRQYPVLVPRHFSGL